MSALHQPAISYHTMRIPESPSKRNMLLEHKDIFTPSNTNDQQNLTYRQKYQLWDSYEPAKIGLETGVEENGYFIYRCDGVKMNICGGWADRLKGAMFTYLLANITGRVFKAEFLVPKCDMTNYIIPN